MCRCVGVCVCVCVCVHTYTIKLYRLHISLGMLCTILINKVSASVLEHSRQWALFSRRKSNTMIAVSISVTTITNQYYDAVVGVDVYIITDNIRLCEARVTLVNGITRG